MLTIRSLQALALPKIFPIDPSKLQRTDLATDSILELFPTVVTPEQDHAVAVGAEKHFSNPNLDFFDLVHALNVGDKLVLGTDGKADIPVRSQPEWSNHYI